MNWSNLINFCDQQSTVWYDYLFAELSEARIKNLSKDWNTPSVKVEHLSSLDPTPTGKYTPWLLNNQHDIYKNPASTFNHELHDKPEVRDITRNLTTFHDNQQKIPSHLRNINDHSLSSLHESMGPYHPSKKLDVNNLPEGSSLEHHSGPYHIVKVTKPEAAHKLCKDSGWCVGHADKGHAHDLLEEAPLHVVYKNGKRFAGVHVESGNFQTTPHNALHKPEDIKDVINHWPQRKKELEHPTVARIHAVNLNMHDPKWEDTIATDAHESLKYAEHLNKQAEKVDNSGKVTKSNVGFEKGEPAIAKNANLSNVYSHLTNKRFPAGEKAIAQSPQESFTYGNRLHRLTGERFHEGEPAIAKQGRLALDYARLHKMRASPEAETSIANHSSNAAYEYSKHLKSIGHGAKFPEGEKSIAHSPMYTKQYLEDTSERMSPEAEHYIADEPNRAFAYTYDLNKARNRIKPQSMVRIPEMEHSIATHGHQDTALAYAHILKDRFPAGENKIKSSPPHLEKYKEHLKNIGKLHELA